MFETMNLYQLYCHPNRKWTCSAKALVEMEGIPLLASLLWYDYEGPSIKFWPAGTSQAICLYCPLILIAFNCLTCFNEFVIDLL